MTQEEEWEEQAKEGKITQEDLESLKKSQKAVNEMDQLKEEKE